MFEQSILVLNAGSSSLKFGLYAQTDGEERPALDGVVDGIGRATGKLELKDDRGHILKSENIHFENHMDAFDHASQWLSQLSTIKPAAIGHRMVHGGPHLLSHQRITPAVLEELKACVHFAPLHIPLAVRLAEQTKRIYPQVPQFACFDTVFHDTMPEKAKRFALPGKLYEEGIRRYGFHGLSFESAVHQLGKDLPARTVIAHLGNGSSLAAVRSGKSMDTSMGLTPTGGIPMATRSGDLDPGVLLYLQRVKKMDTESLEQLLNHSSGLGALSEGKTDMRDLEAAAASGDLKAHLAIDVFCTSICKFIAAYSAVLGGLDMIIFTGGIGEHSARIRANVCSGLEFLGVSIDSADNQNNRDTISVSQSKVRVRIVVSQEDRQIARHCRAMLKAVSH